MDRCRRKRELRPRTIWVGRPLRSDQKAKFPPNKIRNQKYNVITFIPMVPNYLNYPTFISMACHINVKVTFIPMVPDVKSSERF